MICAQLAESEQRSRTDHGRGLVALGDVLPSINDTPEAGDSNDDGDAAVTPEDVDADDPVEQF